MIKHHRRCKKNAHIDDIDYTENAKQNDQRKHGGKHRRKTDRIQDIDGKIYP